ncbi:MAG: TetR/AcrR family transcriptional regulator [Chitinophagaceae bacterium]
MVNRQRKQRDKSEMRQSILDVARVLFLEKGYDLTSMRNIAEQVRCSPGTLYLYFKDKDEIFYALHQEGFSKFLGMMNPLRFVENPFERLKALGRVYMEFALTNKDLYDLMFILQAPMNNEQNEAWEEGQKALFFLKSVLHDCKAMGMFSNMDIEHLSFFIWSSMHGMCALFCRNRCQAYKDHDPVELLEQGYQVFQKILTDLNKN